MGYSGVTGGYFVAIGGCFGAIGGCSGGYFGAIGAILWLLGSILGLFWGYWGLLWGYLGVLRVYLRVPWGYWVGFGGTPRCCGSRLRRTEASWGSHSPLLLPSALPEVLEEEQPAGVGAAQRLRAPQHVQAERLSRQQRSVPPRTPPRQLHTALIPPRYRQPAGERSPKSAYE